MRLLEAAGSIPEQRWARLQRALLVAEKSAFTLDSSDHWTIYVTSPGDISDFYATSAGIVSVCHRSRSRGIIFGKTRSGARDRFQGKDRVTNRIRLISGSGRNMVTAWSIFRFVVWTTMRWLLLRSSNTGVSMRIVR